MSARRTPNEHRVLVIPDAASADRHDAAVANIVRFAIDWQPDRIAILGDHSCCCPCTVDGWKQRGLLGVATDLWAPVGHDHERLMQTVKELRAGYDGPIAMESRFPVAPTAERVRMCDGHCNERLSELTDLGVTSHIVMRDILPGWTAVYLRPDRPGEFAGHHAIALARSLGHSTICAGTGHVATIVETVGAREARQAVEIGGLKAVRRRVRRGLRPQAFGVLSQVCGIVNTYPVLVDAAGAFEFDGHRYQ